MDTIYTLGILMYGLGIRVAALVHPKARQWVKGRQGNFKRLERCVQTTGGLKRTVWFHCASLGEFEQGRPVIERFRELWPGYRIILTFFSPSGYEVRSGYQGADGIFYLPLDTPWNACRWIRELKPELVFFIKYEYWFNFLDELNRKNIPVFIISAVFHREQPFFKWYGRWFRKKLEKISWFFLQNEEGKHLAEELGIKQFTITGDTRFDRVSRIREQNCQDPLIGTFRGDGRIFLGGSTWEPDEALVADLMKQNMPGLKFIIAPHEVHTSRIRTLETKLMAECAEADLLLAEGDRQSQVTDRVLQVVLFSRLTAENAATARIVIVDSIGILARLYRYASFAMIGGGFGAGIHNILEAAAFGSPVFFGPNYLKFTEARELIRTGGAFPVNGSPELIRMTSGLLNDPDEYRRVSTICRNYVEQGQGATERILRGIRNLGFVAPSPGNP